MFRRFDSTSGALAQSSCTDASMRYSRFVFSSRRRHTRSDRDWSSDVCSSDLLTLFKPGLNRSAAIEKSIQTAQATIPGVFLARDLINELSSVTTARFLGTQAQRHCCGRGLSVEVWGKKKIEAMKLAGLLAGNRGSQEELRVIVIRYK